MTPPRTGTDAHGLGARRANWRRRVALAVLALHAGLLAYSAARHSPTIHEMAHLPAGICHWQYGMFELYRVNPPLPRMIAALPVLLLHPITDWGNYQLDPLSRETIPMGVRFAKANGARTLFLFMIARWACIPFCLLGAWTCYRWAGELWGRPAGLASLCLWCFDPLILGHGAVVMPDVPGAAAGVFAAWRFWKWLRAPNWSTAAASGLALGLAELCKTTLLIFFALWPLAWLLYRLRPGARREDYRRHHAPRDHGITRSVMSTVAERLQLLAIVVLAIYVINLGYAFHGSFQRLGDYRFQSRLLSGHPAATPPKVGNRFTRTLLGELPVPLPRDYLQGIDRQRADFEEGGRSYLHGHWSPHGWWYYYLVGLGIKQPVGTLALLAIAAFASVGNVLRGVPQAALGKKGSGFRVQDSASKHVADPHSVALTPHVAQPPSAVSAADAASLPLAPGEGRGERAEASATPQGDSRQARKPDLRWRDELFPLSCGMAMLVLVSSQTGFSAHVRYAIPALPYFFIWCGKLFGGRPGPCRERRLWRSAEGRGDVVSHTAERHGVRSRQASARLLRRVLRRWCFGLAWLCVIASAIESLSLYPDSISFFNLTIGGPAHAHEWLLDSNSAWGQDLVYLKEWVERHPDARPLRLATVGWLDPQVLGIEYTIPRVGPSIPLTDEQRAAVSRHAQRERGGMAFDHRSHHAPRDASPSSKHDGYDVPQTWRDVRSLADLGPQPGWYAIDVNFLHGTHWPATRRPWHFQKIAEEGLNYQYFRLFEPCDRVAYSYLIYHITGEQAAAARRDLSLPALP